MRAAKQFRSTGSRELFTMPMPRSILRDRTLQAEFERRGFVTVPFLEAEEAAYLEKIWSELDDPIHALNFSASVMSAESAYRRRVSAEIGVMFEEKIERLLYGYRFSFGNFITKRAGATEGIPIHQDATFVDETRFESINIWVTLADVAANNGCLRVMPGSHRLNLAARGTNRCFPYPQLAEFIEAHYLVDVPLRAGWACVMSQRTFHTSHPNSSNLHRVCASALAVPKESALYYLYETTRNRRPIIEVYEVDDEFYRRQVYGAPVSAATPSSLLEPRADEVDAEQLQAVFAAAHAGGVL